MNNKKTVIYIIEDEPAHSEALQRSLNKSDKEYEINVIPSLLKFREMGLCCTPNFVIADLNLPDGKALDILTGNIDTMPFPVLIMTAYGDEEIAVHAMKNGAMDYIVKSDTSFREVPRIIDRIFREWEILQKHKITEKNLMESEERYRLLFQNLNLGFALHEIIVDEEGKPCNYRFLEVNLAFEKITGLTWESMNSKTVLDLLPSTEQSLIIIYGKVALTGQSMQFENFDTNLNKYFHVTAYSPRHGQFATIINDITDRKLNDKALIESEGKLKTLFNILPIGISIFDKNLNLVLFNPALENILQLTPEELQNSKYKERKYLHSDFTILDPKDFTAIKALKERIPQYNVETGVVLENSDIIWTSVSAVPVTFPDWALVIVTNDITIRKNAEDALKKKTEELDNYFISSLDLLCIADTKGHFRRLNPEWEEALGYPLKDLEGHSIFELVHPDDIDSTQKAVNLLSEGKDILSFVNRYRHKDGSYRWIEWRSRPEGELIYAAARDITKRLKTENELNESKKLYQNLIEFLPIGVIVHADGRVVFTNPAAMKMLKAESIDKMIGFPIIELVHPEYKNIVKERIKESLNTGRIAKALEEKFIGFDGSSIDVEAIGLPIVFAGKSAMLIIFSDITDRIKNEAEHKKLEEQVHQSQKMEAIGRLAGGVAHDLNNLLSPVLGYSEILLEDHKDNNSLMTPLERIYKAGTRARDLVKQLLAFSRKQTLEFTHIEINKTIVEFEKLLRRMIREDIEIKLFLSSSLPVVLGDRGQIEQVIMNLSINAQDAMPNGGVLTIETNKDEMDIPSKEDSNILKSGQFVVLTISDTGIGISKETISQIFEPFFTTKEVGKGTGLGLATVYGIIKQHEGNINVYSEPSQGTTFKIFLPAIKNANDDKNEELNKPVNILGNETIIVVEDDEMVQDLANNILIKLGYNILLASNGKECLNILEKYHNPVHLLLTDVVMPDMNGKELYNKVIKTHPEIKVLYMSGYTRDVIAHRGVLDEGISFIQKPFSKQGLGIKLREVLNENITNS